MVVSMREARLDTGDRVERSDRFHMPSTSTQVRARALRRCRSRRSTPSSALEPLGFEIEPPGELFDRARLGDVGQVIGAIDEFATCGSVESLRGTGDRVDVIGGDRTVGQGVGQLRRCSKGARTVRWTWWRVPVTASTRRRRASPGTGRRRAAG
jgi:hypothetical protein